jgi:hypothetical protein
MGLWSGVSAKVDVDGKRLIVFKHSCRCTNGKCDCQSDTECDKFGSDAIVFMILDFSDIIKSFWKCQIFKTIVGKSQYFSTKKKFICVMRLLALLHSWCLDWLDNPL